MPSWPSSPYVGVAIPTVVVTGARALCGLLGTVPERIVTDEHLDGPAR